MNPGSSGSPVTLIRQCIENSLQQLVMLADKEGINFQELLEISVPDKAEFGDLSIHTAFKTAKVLKKSPVMVAKELLVSLAKQPDWRNLVIREEIKGPGFINIFLTDDFFRQAVYFIENTNHAFGLNDNLAHIKLLIEFVSANPTGPLTIAHARQSIIGDCLANIFKACGAYVEKEYYINDRGVQIGILGRSVFLRYMELYGRDVIFPAEYYQGEYIRDIALTMKEKYADSLLVHDADAGGEFLKEEVAAIILDQIKADLKAAGVEFDNYFSETSLEREGKIEATLKNLTDRGHTYELEGALWFKTMPFGDDKDRVLKKSNGELTYLSSDIPYHQDKFNRGFNRLINIMGPDHHGYIARLKAAVEALGYRKDQLDVLILQLVTLYQGNVQMHMSTRRGQFVTMSELHQEVGKDALRYFFAAKKTDSHLDFDLELAKKKTLENPMFYIQYACARIAGVIKKSRDELAVPEDLAAFSAYTFNGSEKRMLAGLLQYTEVLYDSARTLEPQRLALYLEKTAELFQKYYSSGEKILNKEDLSSTYCKLKICQSIRQVLSNGLGLLGISVPERM